MKALLVLKSKKKEKREKIIYSLRKKFTKKDIELIVSEKRKKTIEGLKKEIKKEEADCLVVAGGDGTVNGAVDEIGGSSTPLGIIPRGTYNHFARDLGLPDDEDACIEIIAAKNMRTVDIAEANGKIFLNNASIGAYPFALILRDQYENHRGMQKRFAMIGAVIKTFFIFPVVSVTIETEKETYVRKTPFVFIGNNVYTSGKRERLDEGVLSVYCAHKKSRWGILFMGLLSAVSSLKEQYFDEHITKNLTIELKKNRTYVALDGDIISLNSPVQFSVRPQSLKVFAPTKRS
jgi:diacylglycerol kinase family enzyme